MEKLYYHSPYTIEFQAEVISCRNGKKGFEAVLDQTAFYPEGGGQPFDTGTLGGVKVEAVHEKNETVTHYTDGPLEPGTTITGHLDWERRFSNMQQHSGEHIVSGLIHGRFGYDNVGFHMGREEMTIDINGMLTWEQVMDIERDANRVVYNNAPLCVTYPSQEELSVIAYRSKKELTGPIRIVEVPGADICACCGTHVKNAGEIGIIKILSLIHYKGGVRLSLLCGEKALLDYERKTEQTSRLSSLLSAKTESIVEAVIKLKQEAADREARNISLFRKLLEIKANCYEVSDRWLLIFEEEMMPADLRQFCEMLLEKKKGMVVAVCSQKEKGEYSYCIGSRSRDMKQLLKTLNEVLSGRGGGSSVMIQGTFLAEKENIQSAFEEEAAKS